jgi:hypothetical protein
MRASLLEDDVVDLDASIGFMLADIEDLVGRSVLCTGGLHAAEWEQERRWGLSNGTIRSLEDQQAV